MVMVFRASFVWTFWQLIMIMMTQLTSLWYGIDYPVQEYEYFTHSIPVCRSQRLPYTGD